MWGLLIVSVLGACTYSPPATITSDGPIDSSTDGQVILDTPADVEEMGRVTNGLVGLWTFDSSAPLADSSSFGSPVDLTPTGSVTFGPGTVETTSATAKLETSSNPRLNADCVTGGGVSLEAWVSPRDATQGGTSDRRVVAGLTASINSRNVSLLQGGDQWVARVRTNGDANGAPELVPTTDKVVATMTHLVVVADGDERILYINGDPKAVDPNPGSLQGWDFSYRLILGNEFQQSRPWAGTFELVALYSRALSAAEVQRNFLAGPTAP